MTLWEIDHIVSKGEYDYAVVQNHPNATKNGYVLHHRIVMENAMGRLLTDLEIVHHKDENKKNNVPDNLEILSDVKHGQLHAKPAAWVKLLCPCCSRVFSRRRNQTHLVKTGKVEDFCSRQCNGVGRTHTIPNVISLCSKKKHAPVSQLDRETAF